MRWPTNGVHCNQGGHLIAQIFNGPGEQINYLPMKGKELNQGRWKQMENTWKKALQNGSSVNVDIVPIFEGTSKRPVAFKVNYKIDGVKENKLFTN